MNEKWTGTSYSLEKFCNQHRSRFVNLSEAKNHIDFQLPTEHTRVGYLIENIVHSDPDLRAALATIRQNVNNTRDNFEGSVAVLLPVDPFKKSRKRSNESSAAPAANVSSTSTSSSANDGIGSSGVVFKFHDGASYGKLTAAQKSELYEWRQSPRGKKFSEAERKKRKASALKNSTSNKAIHSAVQSVLAQERKKHKRDTENFEQLAELIAGANVSGPVPAPAVDAAANSSSTSVSFAEASKAAAINILKKKRDASKSSK